MKLLISAYTVYHTKTQFLLCCLTLKLNHLVAYNSIYVYNRGTCSEHRHGRSDLMVVIHKRGIPMTCILYRRHWGIQFGDPIVDLTHLRISSSLFLWYGSMECTVLPMVLCTIKNPWSHSIRVGHSPLFGLPSVAILPWLCRKRRKTIFTHSSTMY